MAPRPGPADWTHPHRPPGRPSTKAEVRRPRGAILDTRLTLLRGLAGMRRTPLALAETVLEMLGIYVREVRYA